MSGLDTRIARVRELYAKEQANPVPLKVGDLPTSYEAMTKEWLQDTLLSTHEPKASGAVLDSFQLGPRDDGTAERRLITLEWNDAGKKAGLPPSIFCKATHSLLSRINMAYGGVEFEVQFYNKLRNKVDIEAPRALWAKVDSQSYNSLIILKDMTGLVEFCNKNTKGERWMVEDQLRTLARLHGRFYQSNDPDYTQLLVWGEGFQAYCEMTNVEKACTDAWKFCKDIIPPEYYKREDEIWPATVLSTKRNILLPRSLVHSDVHLGNWYKTKDGRMGLQDYQCLGRGTWARDVAYCLGTALTVADRRAWEKELVVHYLAEFAKAGGPTISEELAWQEIKCQAFTALAYWTLTVTPTENMPQMQTVETCKVFIERLVAQQDDWNALEVLDKVKLDVSMWQ